MDGQLSHAQTDTPNDPGKIRGRLAGLTPIGYIHAEPVPVSCPVAGAALGKIVESFLAPRDCQNYNFEHRESECGEISSQYPEYD